MVNLLTLAHALIILSANGFSPSLRRRYPPLSISFVTNTNINHFVISSGGDITPPETAEIETSHQLQKQNTLVVGESTESDRNVMSKDKEKALKRVLTGCMLAPILVITPLYAIGFMIFGHEKMWTFSEWVYSFAKSSENWLFDSFRRTSRFLSSGTIRARKTAWSYKIHPLFAGISLITSAVLAFIDTTKYQCIISREGLLIANACICFISALSGKYLVDTMLGDNSAKKWNIVQGNTSIAFSVLATSPSVLGNIMVYLNWSLLFTVGILERLYVLCILSQCRIQERKEYMRRYNPQMKVAMLGSIPFGILTFCLRTNL